MKISGLNQTELAKRIGVNQGHLNHWLQGRRAPTVANLKLISERTGISLEILARDL
jgi:transcriptional regulator with XRE-family HTH domain